MREAEAIPPLGFAEARAWLGNNVDDVDGRQVGFAHSLFVDATSGVPTWLVVGSKRRRIGSHVVVPAANCAGAGGRVWVAHDRESIRSSPVVDPSRSLLGEHELAICAHYGIAESVGRAAEVVAAGAAEVTSRPA